MKRSRNVVLAIVMMFALAACGNLISNSYKTLSITQSFYDVAMKSVADLQKQGLVTVEKRAEINKVARIFKEAHNSAVGALEVYKQTNSAADKEKLTVALTAAASKWGQVAKLINAIKPGTVVSEFPK